MKNNKFMRKVFSMTEESQEELKQNIDKAKELGEVELSDGEKLTYSESDGLKIVDPETNEVTELTEVDGEIVMNDASEGEETKKFSSKLSLNKDDTLVIAWENSGSPNAKPLAILVSKDKDVDLPKGEAADIIQDELKRKVDASDFELEEMSFEDFLSDYGNAKNPKRIDLSDYPQIKLFSNTKKINKMKIRKTFSSKSGDNVNVFMRKVFSMTSSERKLFSEEIEEVKESGELELDETNVMKYSDEDGITVTDSENNEVTSIEETDEDEYILDNVEPEKVMQSGKSRKVFSAKNPIKITKFMRKVFSMNSEEREMFADEIEEVKEVGSVALDDENEMKYSEEEGITVTDSENNEVTAIEESDDEVVMEEVAPEEKKQSSKSIKGRKTFSAKSPQGISQFMRKVFSMTTEERELFSDELEEVKTSGELPLDETTVMKYSDEDGITVEDSETEEVTKVDDADPENIVMQCDASPKKYSADLVLTEELKNKTIGDLVESIESKMSELEEGTQEHSTHKMFLGNVKAMARKFSGTAIVPGDTEEVNGVVYTVTAVEDGSQQVIVSNPNGELKTIPIDMWTRKMFSELIDFEKEAKEMAAENELDDSEGLTSTHEKSVEAEPKPEEESDGERVDEIMSLVKGDYIEKVSEQVGQSGGPSTETVEYDTEKEKAFFSDFENRVNSLI